MEDGESEAEGVMKEKIEDYYEWSGEARERYERNKDEEPDRPGKGIKAKLEWYWSKAGYSALISAAIIGPGTMSSMLMGGAKWPWALGWAVLLSAVFAWLATYIASKTTMLTGKNPIDLLSEHIHPIYTYIIVAFASFSMLIVVLFEGVALGSVMNLLTGLNPKIGVWPLVILQAILYAGRRIKLAIRATWAMMLILLVAYALNVVFCGMEGTISGVGILKGFIPTLPSGSAMVIAGAMGGACGFYIYLTQGIHIMEEGRSRPKHLRHASFDALFHGFITFGVYSFLIYWAASAVFAPAGIIPGGGLDAAKSLGPLVGTYAKYIFGIGFAGVAVTTCAACVYYLVEPLASVFRFPPTLRNPGYRKIALIALVIIPGIGPFLGKLLVPFGVFAMAFMTLITIPLIPAWLYLTNSDKIVGKYKNSWWTNLLIFIMLGTLLIAGYSAVGNIWSYLVGII